MTLHSDEALAHRLPNGIQAEIRQVSCQECRSLLRGTLRHSEPQGERRADNKTKGECMVYFGLSVSMTVVWLILAVIFLIVEALTAGLTTIWFAAGALVALICSLFDLALGIQIAIFLIVSICLLVFTRKIFVDELKTGTEKTNTEALIGEKAVVLTEIPAYGVGQVKVGGQVWSAVAEVQENSIAAESLVEIHAIEGVKLIVSPVEVNSATA